MTERHSDRVRAIALAMGFTPIIWTGVGNSNFDTDDWHVVSIFPSYGGVILTATIMGAGWRPGFCVWCYCLVHLDSEPGSKPHHRFHRPCT